MSTTTTDNDPRTAPQPGAAPAKRGFIARLRRPFSRGPSASGETSGKPTDHYSGRRRWPWILALLLVVLLLAGAVYGVFFSPLLGVRSVSISGAPDSVRSRRRRSSWHATMITLRPATTPRRWPARFPVPNS